VVSAGSLGQAIVVGEDDNLPVHGDVGQYPNQTVNLARGVPEFGTCC
jgi:hypothetical protein